MTTTWTTIGQEYSTGDAARACIEREITRLEWHAAKPKLAMPMMQGMAINHAARQTNGRLVRVAWNGALGSMGFYALEKRYTNGAARNYYVDDGTALVCVRSDFTPDENA